jgi:hypothetical protein
VLRFRVFAALACTLSVAACVRTGDGSVVPKYQMTMVKTGWFPHLAWQRTTTDKRHSIHESEFLPPPPPPEQPATERPKARHHVRKAAHRRTRHLAQRKPAAAPQPSTPALKCHEVVLDTGKNRVRCD